MAATAAQLASVLPCFPVKDLSAFHVESLLGGGGFSHVVLARDTAGQEWALKLIPAPGATSLDDVDGTPLLLSEARIHLLLSKEPSVLPCMEAFKSTYLNEREDPKHAKYMAVLRMPVAACSVEEWLFSASPLPQWCQGAPQSQVDEAEVLSVWLQMVNAVHRCHAHGVVHKDIKLPNFLMDPRGKVQVVDFGLAQLEGVSPRAVAGTPWTMSPAGLKHGDDGRAGDWWALGVVLYQLLQGGAWPFKQCWWPWQKGGGERMEAVIRRAVLAGRITFAHGSRSVSEPVKALIRGLLLPDTNRRWQLRQVLACEVVRPELLSDLAQRFPELAPDMQALLQLQRRVREVQAKGSDGGGAAAAAAAAAAAVAGLASAGSAIAAAASSVLRTRGVSALVGDGGLHWPHWHGPGKGDAAGGDGSSYRPLLDGEDQEEGEQPARRSGPSAALSAAVAPRCGAAAPPASLQPAQQLSGDRARLPQLQLHFPDGTANAQSARPGCPNTINTVGAQPQAARVTAPPAWLVSDVSLRNDDGGGITVSAATMLSPGSSRVATATASATGPVTGPILHAMTTSLSVHTGPSNTSSSVRAPSEGDGQRDGPHPHPHPPLFSRRSLTGPPGSPGPGGSPHGGAMAQSPSPRSLNSARSRTSLHELFGPNSGSHPLFVQPLPHARPRPTSAAGLGELLGGVRGTLHHPPSTDGRGSREAGGSEPHLPPQSSWVPPPPEAFTAGAAVTAAAVAVAGRRGDVSSPARSARVAAVPSVDSGGGAGIGAGGSGSCAAPAPVHHDQLGILARARRLFTDCLQRPSVRYDSYDNNGYDTLPPVEKVL